MKKVYIKFGQPLPDDDHIYVYEGLLEDNFVRIILPTSLYSTCVNVAKDMELPGYIVEGTSVGTDKNGQPILVDYKIVSELVFDRDKECYRRKLVYDMCKEKINERPIEEITKPKLPGTNRKESDDDLIKYNQYGKDIGYLIGSLFGGSRRQTKIIKKTKGSYKYKPYTN